MRFSWRRLSLLIALFLSGTLGLFAGVPAPQFSLPDLDGKTVTLDQLIGKGPLVIDFWATWCTPCTKALPKYQELYRKYRDRGLTIVAVNEDGPRSRAKVRSFVSSLGLTFPVLLDTDGEVMRRFRVQGLPALLLLSAEGDILHSKQGYRPASEKELEALIIPLLPEKNVSP